MLALAAASVLDELLLLLELPQPARDERYAGESKDRRSRHWGVSCGSGIGRDGLLITAGHTTANLAIPQSAFGSNQRTTWVAHCLYNSAVTDYFPVSFPILSRRP